MLNGPFVAEHDCTMGVACEVGVTGIGLAPTNLVRIGSGADCGIRSRHPDFLTVAADGSNKYTVGTVMKNWPGTVTLCWADAIDAVFVAIGTIAVLGPRIAGFEPGEATVTYLWAGVAGAVDVVADELDNIDVRGPQVMTATHWDIPTCDPTYTLNGEESPIIAEGAVGEGILPVPRAAVGVYALCWGNKDAFDRNARTVLAGAVDVQGPKAITLGGAALEPRSVHSSASMSRALAWPRKIQSSSWTAPAPRRATILRANG
jgi:hypothetical protein